MSDPRVNDAVRSASVRRLMPGGVEWRILLPDSIGSIAGDLEVGRREVELAALEQDIVPLHYARNIATFAIRGQIALLRGSVAVVSAGAAAWRCLDTLARRGVGELRVLTPPAVEEGHADLLAAGVRNINRAVQVSSGVLDLRKGDPKAALQGVKVVACCLEEMLEESLLQAACRQLGLPLVCGGVQDSRAQVTAILPGDGGVARIYRPEHPHLEKQRPGALLGDGRARQVAGEWLAEQCLALLLGHGDLLRDRLLYADLFEGEMETYPLGG